MCCRNRPVRCTLIDVAKPRTPGHRRIVSTMSSSPELPDRCEIFEERNSCVASCSRARKIPPDSIEGFSRASDVLRNQLPVPVGQDTSIFEYVSDNVEWKASVIEEIQEMKELRPKATGTKVQKRVDSSRRLTQTSNGRAVCQPKKRGQARRLVGESGDVSEDLTISSQRKRPIRPGTDAQLMLGKGRIKKARSTTTDEGNEYVKQQTILPEPSTPRKHISKLSESTLNSEQPLGLDKAAARRRDWTPAKDKGVLHFPGPSESQVVEPGLSKASNKFRCLTSSFSFLKPDAMQTPDNGCVIKGSTTRRQLELTQKVQAKQEHPPNLTPKTVTTKKKPLTITEKVTRQYIDQQLPHISKPSFLLSYLSNEPVGRSNPKKQSNSQQNKNTNKGVRSKSTPAVLSPSEALVPLKDQELVFGTSSQLIQEESSVLIRDKQLVLNISDSDFDHDKPVERGHPPQKIIHKRQANSSIWSAAARDPQGSLLDAQLIDLTTPTVLNFKPTSPLHSSPAPRAVQPEVREVSEPETISPAPCEDMNSKVQEHANHISVKPLNTSTSLSLEPLVKQTSVDLPVMPNFAEQTIEALRKQLKDYGFKPTRSKKTMVAILNKCWLSNHGRPQDILTHSATSEFDDNCQPLLVTRTVPQKRRGRPPKSRMPPDALTRDDTFGLISRKSCLKKAPLQIKSNLEPPPSSQISPLSGDSNKLQAYAGQPVLHTPIEKPLVQPLELIESNYVEHGSVSDEESKEFIFNKITEAIAAYPVSNSPNELSWKEKILLYDPIVLEDLTVWLNTVGFRTVNVDEEIWPTLVRDWCERRSICCFWKNSEWRKN